MRILPGPFPFASLSIVFLATALISPAQITGDVQGLVVDPSGSAVARARLLLKSLETGEERRAYSDTAGVFSFYLLPVGPWSCRAEAGGFRATEIALEARAGEKVWVKVPLEIGPVTETVTVTDALSPLQTVSPQRQISIAGGAVLGLPSLRDATRFAALSPGVLPISPNPFLGPGHFTVNGGRGRGNNILVDNVTASDVVAGGIGGVFPATSLNLIKEAKLITHNFQAEYGRNAHSQFVLISKSGTNELHGELYNYFRNNALNAREFFDRTGNTNPQRYNQPGATLGGPLIRDRLHFFAAYEAVIERGAGGTRIATVPTREMRANITDPTSRALFDQYNIPLPEDESAGFGTLTQQAQVRTDSHVFSGRFDLQLSSADTLTARIATYDASGVVPSLAFIGTNLAGFGASTSSQTRHLNLSETHIFSANLISDLRFGFGRTSPDFQIDSTAPLGPRIQFLNPPFDSFGVSEGFPQGRQQTSTQLAGTVAWARGGHVLKTGADIQFNELDSFTEALKRPLMLFLSFNDFAAGRPAQVIQRFGDSPRTHQSLNHYYFLQDDWRAMRGLTLSLGIRAEAVRGIREANNVTSNLNLDCGEPMGAAGTGPLGCIESGGAIFQDRINWAPRVGFAWTPAGSGDIAIRGGYGVAYDFPFFNPVINQRFLLPHGELAVVPGAALTGDNAYSRVAAGTAAFQQAAPAGIGSIPQNSLNFGTINPAVDQALRSPQSHHFSLGVETRLPAQFLLSASYVGSRTNYLQRSRQLNPIREGLVNPAISLQDETSRLGEFQAIQQASTGSPTRVSNRVDPRFNDVILIDSSASSNYHSLQVEGVRRFSGGWMTRSSWTWGKSIDDSSDALNVFVTESSLAQDPRNLRAERAVSQFDVRHRWVLAQIWEPAWPSGLASRWGKAIFGGWGFSGIASYRTGLPVTLEAGTRRSIAPLSLTGAAASAPVRPNISGNSRFDPQPAGSAAAPQGLTSGLPQNFSSYAASLGLEQPLLGNFGTLGRNTHRLNGQAQVDIGAWRNLRLHESLSLQLRGEVYNLLNQTSFLSVDRNIGSTRFGQYQSTASTPRLIQLAARFIF